MGRKKEQHYVIDILAASGAERDPQVADEIEVICNTYEHVTVSGRDKAEPKIALPLVVENRPQLHRLLLEIVLVRGYPYVAPKVQLKMPMCTQVNDSGRQALSTDEVEQVRREVSDNIQPCLTAGVPCMMQIISTILSVLDTTTSTTASPSLASTPPVATSPGQKDGGWRSVAAGQSPTLTPVPMKAKDALKLSVLTLHVLRKCCRMKEPESREEASSNFDWLASYLLNEVGVFPRAVQRCLPWKSELLSKVFEAELRDSMTTVTDRAELQKWFWEDDEYPLRLQQSSEGRYRSEFIEQRLLGSGGFAPVYVCRKKIDGRLYAIKKVVMSDEQSDKVIREVQTLAALNHKNIVRYYDAWVEDGCEEELRQYLDDEEEEVVGETAVEFAADGLASSATTPSSSSCSSFASSPSSASSVSSLLGSSNEARADDGVGKNGFGSQVGAGEAQPSPPKSRGSHHQTLYIQMELCSARSLRHVIEEADQGVGVGLFASSDGERIAVSILRQLLQVIAHTHREQIVHRDLKPENILFEMRSDGDEEVGTIRVVDFGLARVLNDARRVNSALELGDLLPNGADSVHHALTSGAVQAMPTGNCGSVLYCAPEQEQGLDYDFKVDEFSIGMVALEMWLTIAGKGFRDRFVIMNEVWRTGQLPDWFVRWNPSMADILSRLLVHDAHKRSSCEELLAAAVLPGDPPEFAEALHTIDCFGERLSGRVIQRLTRLATAYRRPSPTMCETAKLLGSSACVAVAQAVHVVGLLHGCSPVAVFDTHIPMNGKLSELGAESVLDAGGRCYCYATLPYFATASFLGMQEGTSMSGTFYQFYHKTRPFALFTSPLKKPDDVNESMLDPLLCLYHILFYMQLHEPLEIIFSHAHWLHAALLDRHDANRRQVTAELGALRTRLDTADKIAPALSSTALMLESVAGVVPQPEREELLHRFTVLALETLGYFGKKLQSNVTLILDPLLLPSHNLMDTATLQNGLFFECRTARGGSLAVGCLLDNFVELCTVLNRKVSAFTVAIDMEAMMAADHHIRMPVGDNLVLNGAAVKRQDLYSQAHLSSVLQAAVRLWAANVRAFLSADSDAHRLAEVLKARQIRWVLLDGKLLLPASSSLHNRAGSRQQTMLSLDEICTELRRSDSAARTETTPTAGCSTQEVRPQIIFLGMKKDVTTASRVQELFAAIASQGELATGTILVVNEILRKVEQCLQELDEVQETTCLPVLAQWLRGNRTSYGVVPVYAARDDSVTFFVNQKYLKRAQKKAKDGSIWKRK